SRRALRARRRGHDVEADTRRRRRDHGPRGEQRAAAALERVARRGRCRGDRAHHGPRAARHARRLAHVAQAHVFLEREGRARARLRVARSARGDSRRGRLVQGRGIFAMKRAKARAGANFALIKYWGKADARLNVPAVGSISVTLDALWSETEVRFDPALAADDLVLDGARRPEQLAKVSACVDLLRARAGIETRAFVESRNNFPTGAGLASSASGFAAL